MVRSEQDVSVQQRRALVENAALRAVPQGHGRVRVSGFMSSWGVDNLLSRSKGPLRPPEAERFFLLTDKRLWYFRQSLILGNWQHVVDVCDIKCAWIKSTAVLVLLIHNRERSLGATYLELAGAFSTLRNFYLAFRSMGAEVVDSTSSIRTPAPPKKAPAPPRRAADAGESAQPPQVASPRHALAHIGVSWQGKHKATLFEMARFEVDATDAVARGLSIQKDDITLKFELKSQLLDDSGLAADYTVARAAVGRFTVSYRVSLAGEYLVHLLFCGAEHPGGPFHLDVVNEVSHRAHPAQKKGRSNTVAAVPQFVGTPGTPQCFGTPQFAAKAMMHDSLLEEASPRPVPLPVPPPESVPMPAPGPAPAPAQPEQQQEPVEAGASPVPPPGDSANVMVSPAPVLGSGSLHHTHAEVLSDLGSPRGGMDLATFQAHVMGLVELNFPKNEVLLWLYALWESGKEVPNDTDTLANMMILEQLNEPM